MYQLTNGNFIIRLSDGAIIPIDVTLSEYQEYEQWIADGNTPDPIPAPTLDEQVSVINAKYQPALDNYKDLILNAWATDGATQTTKITNYQNLYNATIVKKNNELAVLYNG